MEIKTARGQLKNRDPGVTAWIRMMRVYTEIDRRTSEFLKPYDLTTAQFDVIAQVGGNEGLTQQELANALLVTKGNITQLLDRLEAHGLVERRQRPGTRGKCIYLTEAGWALNERVVPQQESHIAGLFAVLEPHERQALGRTLRTMERSLLP